nr:hypothetical protein [Segatella copri]
MKQVEERYISFEASKMAYRDIKNSVDTAKREGIAEGKEIGMKEGMEKGLAEGMEKVWRKAEQKASMRPTQKQHNDCWQWDFLPNRFPKLPSYLWKSLRI